MSDADSDDLDDALLDRAHAVATRFMNREMCRRVLVGEGFAAAAVDEALEQVFEDFDETQAKQRHARANIEKVLSRLLRGDTLDDPTHLELVKPAALRRRAKLRHMQTVYRSRLRWALGWMTLGLAWVGLLGWSVYQGQSEAGDLRVPLLLLVLSFASFYFTGRPYKRVRDHLAVLETLCAEQGWEDGRGPRRLG